MFFSKFVKLCSSVGKSPGAVAEEMGINRSTVSCWKSRKSKPTDISLQKIANYFNVSVDYLLDKETKQGSPAIKSIGERIKARREELNLSQEDLAKRIGYQSRSSINKIELGYQNLQQSKIKEIAEALETTPSYIMGWDDERFANPLVDILCELSDDETEKVHIFIQGLIAGRK